MDEKQKQRSENIKQHIQQKREQKLSKNMKERPGYEGAPMHKHDGKPRENKPNNSPRDNKVNNSSDRGSFKQNEKKRPNV